VYARGITHVMMWWWITVLISHQSPTHDNHVDDICKVAYHHTKAFRHIRKCISDDDAKTIAATMVSTRLDYCNSVLYNTSHCNISKLQRVHNALARAVTCTRNRDHITPILADLHWLPIADRIDYKVALQTFKTLTTKQPSYTCTNCCRFTDQLGCWDRTNTSIDCTTLAHGHLSQRELLVTLHQQSEKVFRRNSLMTCHLFPFLNVI